MEQPVLRKELKAGWENEKEVPVYSVGDVAKHKTKTDLWITIHGHGKSRKMYLTLWRTDTIPIRQFTTSPNTLAIILGARTFC